MPPHFEQTQTIKHISTKLAYKYSQNPASIRIAQGLIPVTEDSLRYSLKVRHPAGAVLETVGMACSVFSPSVCWDQDSSVVARKCFKARSSEATNQFCGVNLTSPWGTAIAGDEWYGFGNTVAGPELLHIPLHGEASLAPRWDLFTTKQNQMLAIRI